MRRISSRGNPWHDERGRFCSKDKACRYKVGNEFIDVSHMTMEEKTTLAQSSAKSAQDVDVQEYYKEQTANRAKYADSLSRYTPRKEIAFSKDDTPEERQKKMNQFVDESTEAYGKFRDENRQAIDSGARTTYSVNKETGEVRFNVYNSAEIINQARKGLQTKDGRLYIDTSTNMRTNEGYVVTASEDDNKTRSCRRGATPEEMKESLDSYIEKNKEELAEQNKHLCVWESNGQMHFTIATWHKTKQEAQTEGNKRLRAHIADCSTGKRVSRNKSIEAAENKYRDVKKKTTGKVSYNAGEYVVGNDKDGGIVWNGKKFEDTRTGETLGKRQVWDAARGERDKVRNLIAKGQKNVTKR